MDHDGYFDPANVATLSEAGLLGLVIPESYGGLGGGLRDWAAACFAIGTVCPSTGLCLLLPQHIRVARHVGPRGARSRQVRRAGSRRSCVPSPRSCCG